MRSLPFLVLAFAFGLCLSGCGDQQTVGLDEIPAGQVGSPDGGVDAIHLVGDWSGQLMMEEDPLPDEEVDLTPQQRDAAVTEVLGGYQLSLYENRTFSFYFGVFPVSGTWSVAGGKILLETDSALGRTEQQVIDGNFNDNVRERILEMFQTYELRYDVDGKYLEYDDGTGNLIRFTR